MNRVVLINPAMYTDQGVPDGPSAYRVEGNCTYPGCNLRLTRRLSGTREACEQAKLLCSRHEGNAA